MDNTNVINNESRQLFDNGEYFASFSKLLQLNAGDFYKYSQKVDEKKLKSNWLLDDKSSSVFWKDFIVNESIFEKLFVKEYAQHLLHLYFSKIKIDSPEFISLVAKNFPEELIKSVRVNTAFLEDRHFNLLSIYTKQEKISKHFSIWKLLKKTENDLWKKFENDFEVILSLSITEILGTVTVWIEIERFGNIKQQQLEHLGKVYSAFIEFLLFKRNVTINESIDFKMKLNEVVLENAAKQIKSKSKLNDHKIFKALSSLSEWIDFKEGLFNTYCYATDFDLHEEDEVIYLKTNPIDYYKWKIDGLRYNIVRFLYELNSEEFIQHLITNNEIKIPGKTEEDYRMNYVSYRDITTINFLLHDLCISGIKQKNGEIKSFEKILQPLVGYSNNRQSRYDFPILKLSDKYKNWGEVYGLLTLNLIQDTTERFPFIFDTIKDYTQKNKDVYKEFKDSDSVTIIELFGYYGNKEFNRNNLQYDVFYNPFLILNNNYLFCPVAFFSNNIWFYSLTQKSLLQKSKEKNLNETKEMERYLGELFINNGIKNIKIEVNDNKNNIHQQNSGDIDIFIEDDACCLLIQLKRTYFRIEPKDAYNEEQVEMRKASSQLNKAEEFLKSNNKVSKINITNKIVHKWIVSNSFEFIGKNYNGCVKVNYLELIHALRKYKFNSLNELIDFILKDKYLLGILNNLHSSEKNLLSHIVFSQFGFPIPLYEKSTYEKPIIINNEKLLEVINLYHKGLDNSKNSKENAIKYFEKYLKVMPNDAEAWDAIANVHADLKDFDKALFAFDKALSISPNDPYIKRNKAICLRESGQDFLSLELFMDLYQTYPLLGDIFFHIEYLMNIGIKEKKLNIKDHELVLLVERWNKIK